MGGRMRDRVRKQAPNWAIYGLHLCVKIILRCLSCP